MLKRTRKRSAQITLVLLGAAALAACDDQSEHRDLYTSKQDCVQDWGDETKCEPAPDGAKASGRSHSSGMYYWGPHYSSNSYRPGASSTAVGSSLSPARSGSRAIGSSSSVSRGGFGSSSSSHSSGS